MIGDKKSSDKEIDNTYAAANLAVKKVVTGNMGDRTKEFNVTVTFTAPAGKTVNSTITYLDGEVEKKIEPSAWKNGPASATITLRHDETVTFKNIPYGVTYSVAEDNYTTDDQGKYDAPSYSYSDETKKINEPAVVEVNGEKKTVDDTVTITNNKTGGIDTGIVTDNLPYIVLLAFVAVAVVAMKKRSARNF